MRGCDQGTQKTYDKAQNKAQVKAQSGALSDREYILLLERESFCYTE